MSRDGKLGASSEIGVIGVSIGEDGISFGLPSCERLLDMVGIGGGESGGLRS